MNKRQFLALRRAQRICYSDDYGWPLGKEKYFNQLPLQRPSYVTVYIKKSGEVKTLLDVAKWCREKEHSGDVFVRNIRNTMRINLLGGRTKTFQLRY